MVIESVFASEQLRKAGAKAVYPRVARWMSNILEWIPGQYSCCARLLSSTGPEERSLISQLLHSPAKLFSDQISNLVKSSPAALLPTEDPLLMSSSQVRLFPLQQSLPCLFSGCPRDFNLPHIEGTLGNLTSYCNCFSWMACFNFLRGNLALGVWGLGWGRGASCTKLL